MENPKKPPGPSAMTQHMQKEGKAGATLRTWSLEGNEERLKDCRHLHAHVELTRCEHPQRPQNCGGQRLRSSVSPYKLQWEVLTSWARSSHLDKTDLSHKTHMGCHYGGLDVKEAILMDGAWALGSKAGRMGP